MHESVEYASNNTDVMLEDQHQRDPNVGFIKFMKNVATIGTVIKHFRMTCFDGIPTTIGDNKNMMNKLRITLWISTPHQCKYPSLYGNVCAFASLQYLHVQVPNMPVTKIASPSS